MKRLLFVCSLMLIFGMSSTFAQKDWATGTVPPSYPPQILPDAFCYEFGSRGNSWITIIDSGPNRPLNFEVRNPIFDCVPRDGACDYRNCSEFKETISLTVLVLSNTGANRIEHKLLDISLCLPSTFGPNPTNPIQTNAMRSLVAVIQDGEIVQQYSNSSTNDCSYITSHDQLTKDCGKLVPKSFPLHVDYYTISPPYIYNSSVLFVPYCMMTVVDDF